MKKLLMISLGFLMPLGASGQTVKADYSAFVDLAVRYVDARKECLAGADATVVYYHSHPASSVLRMRNFIEGECALPGGNHLKLPGKPLRSYQHSSAWRYYNLVFDGQDKCGVLYFSGKAEYMGESLGVRLEDYSANRCHQLVPPARMVITEYQSGGYFNRYFYMAPAHEQAHFHIFD